MRFESKGQGLRPVIRVAAKKIENVVEVKRLARLKMTDWFGDTDSSCVLHLEEPEIASDPVSPGESSPPG